MEIMKKALTFCLSLNLLILFTFLSQPGQVSASGSSGAPYTSEWRISGPSGGDVRALVVDRMIPIVFILARSMGRYIPRLMAPATGACW